MSRTSYKSNNDVYINRTQRLLNEMPNYMKEFVYHYEGNLAPRTIHAYLFDLKEFFDYLIDHNPLITNYQSVTTEILDSLSIFDFNEYFHMVRNRSKDPSKNIARKKASLKKLYEYLLKNKEIKNKDFLLIEAEKIRKKETIVKLDTNEVNLLKNNVATGFTLTSKQKMYQNKHTNDTIRNIAIISLLLGTGIRISECVGLDLDDLFLEKNMIHVIRKGNKEQNLYFPDSVKFDLEEYVEVRINQIKERYPDATALFLNEKTGTRYTVRSVERIVKKFAPAGLVGGKNISPHRLRATFATSILDEEGIEKVQKLLGHENISTTTIYASSSEEQLKEAGLKERYQEQQD